LKIACDYFKKLSDQQKKEFEVEHFDIEFYDNIVLFLGKLNFYFLLFLDMFHRVKSPLTNLLAAAKYNNGNRKTMKFWSQIFIDIYFQTHQKEIPTNDLIFPFCKKLEIIKAVSSLLKNKEFRSQLLQLVKFKNCAVEANVVNPLLSSISDDLGVNARTKVNNYNSARVDIYFTLLLDFVPLLTVSISSLNFNSLNNLGPNPYYKQ